MPSQQRSDEDAGVPAGVSSQESEARMAGIPASRQTLRILDRSERERTYMSFQDSKTLAMPVQVQSVGQQRLPSVDIYRGFVMFLMVAEVLHLSSLDRK